ncbi:MAG TPA: type I-E CRISPR-associated protein Cse2/CasB [Candidatus Omnitrophota bacterium]|nr:type I-E CRISPR-associated protein Cse2/CasB [Candidatus Omnitrophota bacterium]HQO57806.1 type I-E CRISPR-associated protein Cse2/CasB [Candidatus Omnitrophota bacterium]HQQ88315.1 type I-E CRISPR-associated protein Cse2/CasB [Smithellaceae bacterium]
METRCFERLFDPGDESGKILFEWWEELDNQRGDRARLRRARNPDEVVFIPVYHQLYHRLRLKDREALACVAGLCAHVKENNSGTTLAEQMAEGDKKAKVSGLRFRRLLKIDEREEMYNFMRRILHLLGNTVDIYSLAKTVYWWNQKTKKELAYKYYEKAPEKEQ